MTNCTEITVKTQELEVFIIGFENKTKFALWVYPQTLKDVGTHYQHDNCKSQSEFIEKAIRFYIGYLDEEKSVNYMDCQLKIVQKLFSQRESLKLNRS